MRIHVYLPGKSKIGNSTRHNVLKSCRYVWKLEIFSLMVLGPGQVRIS